LAFSQLVAEQKWIKEIDINPLFASADELVALDARVILHDAKLAETALPKLAIRAYPTKYVSKWKTKNGTQVTIRPIRPEDEPLLVKFHKTLSPESVYLRYFNQLKLDERIAHERLVRICFNDYDREMALVAELKLKGAESEILGVGRLTKERGLNEAEFALLVSRQVAETGIGHRIIASPAACCGDGKLSRASPPKFSRTITA
jgi:acetyltransferase